MIAYDSNPASTLSRNMNKDLLKINEEISPRQVPKMGIHRRNKTTENSNIFKSYLSQERFKEKKNLPVIDNTKYSKTFKISSLLEEAKGLADSKSQ